MLERHRIAERWRSQRWDGLRFQFPNWSVGLPDFPFDQKDPNGFASSLDIVAYLDAYAQFIGTSVRCGVNVTRLRRAQTGGYFIAETAQGPIEASKVVVATGPYQKPIVPTLLSDKLGVFQVHASDYKNPGQLPAGAVLIVGSGASGAQLAEELNREGRRVYLSVSRHRRLPRRYRGRDLIGWLSEMGLDRTPTENRGPDTILPLITGAYGGHTIDLRDFAQRGIRLLGRILSERAGVLNIASDLRANIEFGDVAYAAFLDMVDTHVDTHVDAFGLDAAPEPSARVRFADPQSFTEPMDQLDLNEAGVTSVIWATGYSYDFSWIDVPVFEDNGEPRRKGGVTDVPGLYFLGLPWLSKLNSSFLSGIGDDAASLADHIDSARPAACAGQTSQP